MPRASTHIFRVQLWPNVYRDIEIDSNKSLYDLAVAIIRAFGFEFDHAFGFFSKCSEPQSSAAGIAIIGRSCPKSLQRI